MGNACGCGSEKPIDPTAQKNEQKRQEELAEALKNADTKPVDLQYEFPNATLHEAEEVEEQSAKAEEVESVDSDIIPEEKIPPKAPVLAQMVKNAILQKIMKQETRNLQMQNSELIKIF